MHDYAWFHPAGQTQADYITAMDNAGGFLLTNGTAPVWIGEFGTGNDSLAAVGASTPIGASSPADGNLGAWFSKAPAGQKRPARQACSRQLAPGRLAACAGGERG